MVKCQKEKIFTFRTYDELQEYRKKQNEKQNECARKARQRRVQEDAKQA